MNLLPCSHWSHCGVTGGGCCSKNLFGGRPSFGVCLKACEEYDGPARGRGDLYKKVLSLTLIHQAVKAVNPDCGCGARQLDQNAKHPAEWTTNLLSSPSPKQ